MQRLVFEIASSPFFPAQDICKVCNPQPTYKACFVILAPCLQISNRLHRHTPVLTDDDPYTTFRTSCCALKEPTLARLDQLMHHIQSMIETNAKINSSHILELYTHKLLDCELREKTLQQRLEQALKSVSDLSYDQTMQSMEFDRYNALVYESATQVERLTVTCEELRSDLNIKQKMLQTTNWKLDENVQKSARDRRDAEQRLAISAAEVMSN